MCFGICFFSMDEDQFNELSYSSQSRLEVLEKFPVLNIFPNVEEKWEFLKKSAEYYKCLQTTCPSKYGRPSFAEILRTVCQEIDCKLLSSLEFVTVSKLVDELDESYCLSLPLQSAEEEKSFSSIPDLTGKTNGGNVTSYLPQKKFLLLAKIIHTSPGSLSNGNQPGFLFLSDGSSKIHCQIKSSLCDEMLLLFNKWILISNANVIFSSQLLPGILEICSKPIPLGVSVPFLRNPISVLNVKDASIFLHNREKFKPAEICVTGLLTAVSEVVRIKQDLIFFIELCQNEEDGHYFYILLKEEFVHWQPLLNPGSCYVFSALRASKLVKGCGPDPVKVFVPCPGCKVWPQKYCQLQEQELKDLLSEEFKVEKFSIPIEKKFLNFTSYQGCITDTDRANDGIYILNNQVRLHLFYIPLVHHFGHLRVGSIIQLHNVHLKEYSEVPKIQLFCCMKSCIKTLEFSPLNSLPVLVNVDWAQEMAFFHSANTNWLLEARSWFISNSSLLRLKHQRHIDVIWNSFLHSTVNEKTEMAVKTRRNLLQEFFFFNHKCPISIKEGSDVEQSFPSFACPSNLLQEDFPSLILYESQQSTSKPSANINKEEHFWEPLVKKIQGTKMLIAYIAVSSVTGRLCLVDDMNSINIICQPWQMNVTSDSLSHKCTSSCLLQQKETKLVFPCPFAHSWCLGRLIIIDNYQMVLEKFISASNAQNMIIRYIEFSLKNVAVLNGSLLPSFYPQFQPNSKDEDNICTCQMFMFLYKESLMGYNLSTENPALRFTANGYFLGNSFEMPAKNVFRYATKFPRSEELQNTKVENTCEKEKLDDKPYDRVVLLFENSQWYDILQNVGSCYMLVVRGKNPKAFSSCHLESLVNVLRNSNSKYPVQMPQNAIVQELTDWHLNTIYKTQKNTLLNLKKIVSAKLPSRISPAYSISDIVSPSFSENIVSLLPARILSRTHPENMYSTSGSRNTPFSDSPMNDYNTELELSTLGGKSIKLVLQDIKSYEELMIFMNLENTSYPLGLLAGAIVEFHLLQRIMSKKNKVYCKFIAISSVRIVALSYNGNPNTDPRFCSNFSDQLSSKDEWGTFSLMLSDFYSERNLIWTQAFVSQVKKFTIKTLCTKCSCLSSCYKCSDKTCNNTQFCVSIFACLLLDDGTCTTHAYTWDQDILIKILRLSVIQWKDLVDLIHSKWGQICLDSKGNCAYSDTSNEETHVQNLLSVLCNNPLVKQKWWMKLKMKRRPFAASSYEERYPFREIGFVGGKIQTRCFPFLQVEILSIQEDSPFYILST